MPENMQFNLPTWLTLLRIILIPVMVAIFYLPWHLAHVACAAIFGVAGLTDWLDGYLARKMSQTTLFGAFLDPVADKLMVSVALVLIVQADPNPWVAIASAVIIGREIAIASLREWMAEIGQRNKVEVSWIGKWKTTAQIVAIETLLLGIDVWKEMLRSLGLIMLLVSAALTLWSMFKYMQAALPALTKHDAEG
jgi:CDP-diacylglycerol--glycerol-3-phosphate 3-phosphatidyltransferase